MRRKPGRIAFGPIGGFLPMQHTSEWQRALRAAVASTLALSMGALGVASAEAATITPDSVSPSAHFTDCLSALFSDPAAHQQYCGGGASGPLTTTTPSTLAPTTNSPEVTCLPPVGSIFTPLFSTFKTASLDTAGLKASANVAFDFFSVGARYEGFGLHSSGMRVATRACCPGNASLSRPSFYTFSIATLEGALVVPQSALPHVGDLSQSYCNAPQPT